MSSAGSNMTHPPLDPVRHPDLALRALEQSGEAICVVTPDVRYAWVNAEFCRLTGYAPDEVVGQPVAIMRADVHDSALYQEMHDAIFRDGVWHGEVWRRKKDGEAFPALLTVSAVLDQAGEIECFVDFFSDMGAANTDRERLEFLINHDALTELPNRRLFQDRLATAIKRAERYETSLCLIFVDLDNFKQINDRLGHAAGDRVLARIGSELQHAVRDADTIARVGGDEFVILLEGGDPAALREEYFRRINAALSSVADELDIDIALGASLGIASHPQDGETPDALYAAADKAMYAEKEHHRDPGPGEAR